MDYIQLNAWKYNIEMATRPIVHIETSGNADDGRAGYTNGTIGFGVMLRGALLRHVGEETDNLQENHETLSHLVISVPHVCRAARYCTSVFILHH